MENTFVLFILICCIMGRKFLHAIICAPWPGNHIVTATRHAPQRTKRVATRPPEPTHATYGMLRLVVLASAPVQCLCLTLSALLVGPTPIALGQPAGGHDRFSTSTGRTAAWDRESDRPASAGSTDRRAHRALQSHSASASFLGGGLGVHEPSSSVNVQDFGADPHSHNDSTTAFNATFKHAQAIANGLGGADDGA